MSENNSLNELYMSDETTPVDILEFVVERTASPAVMRNGEVVVYNYHNESLVAHAITEWAQDAEDGVYVVPYQISGVWAFMQRTLPKAVRDADILAYRKSEDTYVDYENWRRTYVDPDEEFEDAEAVRTLIDGIRWEVVEVLDHV